jgi:peptidoglycan/xylan/chitin deacetylase (PgdA/CDA1 family)
MAVPQNARLILHFDTESVRAKAPPDYSTDAARPDWLDEALKAAASICNVLNDTGARASFFIVGRLLELAGDEYADLLGNERFDIGNHTFNHWKVCPAKSDDYVERFTDELTRTAQQIERCFGTAPTGFTTPGGYYRGLAGKTQPLGVLHDQGYRYISSDAQPRRDSPACSPAPFNQPHWYDEDGFGDLLEIPLTGWHCNLLFNTGGQNDNWQPAPGFPDGTILERLPRTVEEGFAVRKKEFQYAIDHDLVYQPCMHPWSVYRADPMLDHLRRLIEMARAHDVPVVNCRDVYDQYAPRRGGVGLQ